MNLKAIQTFVLVICTLVFTACSDFPTTSEIGLRYATTPAVAVSSDIEWQQVGFATEIINAKEKLVYYGGGSHPISRKEWEDFSVQLPWVKNIDRHLLFTKTAFLRSPSAASDCVGQECFIEREYKKYSWVELAQPIATDFIPAKTDMKKPTEGHLSVKVIKKCQIVVWENEIYELSDDKGNKYVMHATETGMPNLDVILPPGFSLKKVALTEPLVVVPFGDEEDCYLNIVGDHLGQGYHQYRYAGDYYPQ